MRTTPTGRKSRSHAEWQELVEKQEQSGLSIGAFCKRKGVARTSFDKWKNRLSEVQKSYCQMLCTTASSSLSLLVIL